MAQLRLLREPTPTEIQYSVDNSSEWTEYPEPHVLAMFCLHLHSVLFRVGENVIAVDNINFIDDSLVELREWIKWHSS